MGTTLQHGIFLPAEGERNCYAGLASNWTILDGVVGGYSSHAANLTIHVTAADKEAWNGKADASALTAHTGDTTIHVTAEDKQAWNEHVADTVKHVTASDKQTWNGKQDALSQTQLDAVNSGIDSSKVQQIATNTSDISSLQSGKANDSDVVHKSGNETVRGNKTFSYPIAITAYPSIRMYLADDEWDVSPQTTKQSEIRFMDKNSVTVSCFVFQHRTDSTEPFRTCWRQQKMDGTSGYYGIDFNNLGDFYPENNNNINFGTSSRRWKSVYATNYYYGSNNVEFSTKFVTTDTAQTISGDKTFSSINGVEPSSLSLPSGTLTKQIDISSYFANTGSGDTNTYTALANGWIYLRLANIDSCQATVYDANNNRMWGQTTTGSVEQLTIPILKGQTLSTQWDTSSTVNVANARFIPCQGNV